MRPAIRNAVLVDRTGMTITALTELANNVLGDKQGQIGEFPDQKVALEAGWATLGGSRHRKFYLQGESAVSCEQIRDGEGVLRFTALGAAQPQTPEAEPVEVAEEPPVLAMAAGAAPDSPSQGPPPAGEVIPGV